MTSLLLRVAGLTAVYLLVLTSVDPGDIATGVLVAVAVTVGLQSARPTRADLGAARLAAFGRMLLETGREMVVGSWRVVRFCLGAPMAPGFVAIPRAERSGPSVALWGVLTGEAPDEVPVDVDRERGLLIVHLVDASDPAAVRRRHAGNRERTLRHVVG